jgi:hypothetical protein
MTDLTLTPNIPDPDGFLADLIGANEGLSDHESMALDARPVLVLAHHVGGRAVLDQALATARNAGLKTGDDA